MLASCRRRDQGRPRATLRSLSQESKSTEKRGGARAETQAPRQEREKKDPREEQPVRLAGLWTQRRLQG